MSALVTWAEKLANYRQLLFGLGSEESKVGQRTLDPARAWEVCQAGGRLSLTEVLRLKVWYFSEGITLGLQGFVSEVFGHWRSEASA